MLFILFFLIAFFVPVAILRPTNLLIGFLPLLLWGKYIFRFYDKSKWYLLILFILLIRLIGQYLFSEYQSPYIFGDLYRLIMFLGSVYIFQELFKNEDNIKKFCFYLWKLSQVLIVMVFVSYLLNLDFVTIDSQNRFRWFAWPNSGGPGFSKVFTFVGIIYLYYINDRFPNASFKKRLFYITKIIPCLLLCILGGTRLSLFIFIIAILLYLKNKKILIFILPLFAFLFFDNINQIASLLPGFSRLKIGGGGVRVMIWINFLLKIFENNHTFWWGYGPGYIMLDIYDPISGMIGGYFYSTHNLFLQIWLGYGIIFFIVFTMLYIWFVYKVYSTKHTNNMIFGLLGFILATEIFGTSYLAYDCSWICAVSYAILFNSLKKKNSYNNRLVEVFYNNISKD